MKRDTAYLRGGDDKWSVGTPTVGTPKPAKQAQPVDSDANADEIAEDAMVDE